MARYVGYAFSLIELMVVIAIIAILAAVAIPAYKSYVMSARISSVVPIIEAFVNKSIIHASTNGAFGSAYDFGLNPSNAGTDSGTGVWNPTTLSPYFSASYAANASPVREDTIGDVSYITANNICGANGLVFFGLDPAAVGYPSDAQANAQILLECDYWNIDSVIQTNCWYMYTDPNDPTGTVFGSTNLIPGWLNACLDSTCATTNPNVAIANNSSSYYSATCP
jgi:prepilin-type N-terminal cleavage/methylation domain-containing protein